MRKCEELAKGLLDIADELEQYRMKIWQTETPPWEDEKQNVDDELFSLQSQIRHVSEIVEYMDFV